jgi:DNA-binding transcriptional MerR regulator
LFSTAENDLMVGNMATIQDKRTPDGPSNLPNFSTLHPTLSIRELIQIANTFGIDVDVSTLRFWQRQHLVPPPVPGPSPTGRGTRGRYDQFILDRLAFIREVQRKYGMRLEMIREELEHLDKKILQSGNRSPALHYKERLEELRSKRESEIHQFLFALVANALNISPEEISVIVIRRKEGETIRLTEGQPQLSQLRRM